MNENVVFILPMLGDQTTAALIATFFFHLTGLSQLYGEKFLLELCPKDIDVWDIDLYWP